jgi:hypothetical protein
MTANVETGFELRNSLFKNVLDPLVAPRSGARLVVSTGLPATQSIGAKRKTARRDKLLLIQVGATGRLLNFSAKVWPVGMPTLGGKWMTLNRSRIDSYGLALMPSTAGNASGRQVLESWLDSDAVNAWIK